MRRVRLESHQSNIELLTPKKKKKSILVVLLPCPLLENKGTCMWSCLRCHAIAICGIHLVPLIGWGFTSITHSFHYICSAWFLHHNIVEICQWETYWKERNLAIRGFRTILCGVLRKVPEAIVLKVILYLWNSYISDNLVDALYKLKNLFLCIHHTFIGLQCSFLCRWF